MSEINNKKWLNSRLPFREWGRYLGQFDVVYLHTASFTSDGIVVDTVNIEERAKEIRHENHFVRISEFYYLERHIASYDSRRNYLYLNLSYITRDVPGDIANYKPRIDYIRWKFETETAARNWRRQQLTIEEGMSIKLFTVPPSFTQRQEDLCSSDCMHHPIYMMSHGGAVGYATNEESMKGGQL